MLERKKKWYSYANKILSEMSWDEINEAHLIYSIQKNEVERHLHISQPAAQNCTVLTTQDVNWLLKIKKRSKWIDRELKMCSQEKTKWHYRKNFKYRRWETKGMSKQLYEEAGIKFHIYQVKSQNQEKIIKIHKLRRHKL